jgi:hypothetical protein
VVANLLVTNPAIQYQLGRSAETGAWQVYGTTANAIPSASGRKRSRMMPRRRSASLHPARPKQCSAIGLRSYPPYLPRATGRWARSGEQARLK